MFQRAQLKHLNMLYRTHAIAVTSNLIVFEEYIKVQDGGDPWGGPRFLGGLGSLQAVQ